MTNVVKLDGTPAHIPGTPDASLVEMLADMLEMAKSGELQSFVGTGFVSNGDRVSVWHTANQIDVFQMMGAINWLEHEFADHVTDKNGQQQEI